MTATLRARTDHAAKYGANLVVPARDIRQLLNERDHAEARIEAVQNVLNEWGYTSDAYDWWKRIRNALATLPDGGEQQ